MAPFFHIFIKKYAYTHMRLASFMLNFKICKFVFKVSFVNLRMRFNDTNKIYRYICDKYDSLNTIQTIKIEKA